MSIQNPSPSEILSGWYFADLDFDWYELFQKRRGIIASMNPNQLATEDEAKALALQLAGVGNGVKEWYIPEYDGPWSAPEMGASKFYHYRFNNGAEGFNVGLVRTLKKQCPTSWLNMIATEIGYQIKFQQEN